jgi:hypothetical protein
MLKINGREILFHAEGKISIEIYPTGFNEADLLTCFQPYTSALIGAHTLPEGQTKRITCH